MVLSRLQSVIGVFGFAVCLLALICISNPSIAVAFREFEATGMFRPVYWLASSVDASPQTAMVVGLLTAGAMLGLMMGFGIGTPVSVLIIMLWLWHPLHVGLWQKLSSAECIALPFAILSLECARRASGKQLGSLWDYAWVGFAILAMMSRNAFVGIVPAVLLTRLGPDELTAEAGRFIRVYGRAIICGAMLILGGVGLSSSLGEDAIPELALVGLGLYLLLAAGLNMMAELPRFQMHQASWVGVGAILVAVLAWNISQQGGVARMF